MSTSRPALLSELEDSLNANITDKKMKKKFIDVLHKQDKLRQEFSGLRPVIDLITDKATLSAEFKKIEREHHVTDAELCEVSDWLACDPVTAESYQNATRQMHGYVSALDELASLSVKLKHLKNTADDIVLDKKQCKQIKQMLKDSKKLQKDFKKVKVSKFGVIASFQETLTNFLDTQTGFLETFNSSDSLDDIKDVISLQEKAVNAKAELINACLDRHDDINKAVRASQSSHTLYKQNKSKQTEKSPSPVSQNKKVKI